ncbi:MAG: porin family protein [Ketobacter sp.]
MKRLISIIVAAVTVTSANSALAGTDSGFYVGGSLGSAKIDYSQDDPSLGDIDFDEDDTGYKVFGGYNFGIIPLIDVAVEGAYVNFGEQQTVGPILTSESEITGLSAFGLAGLTFGPFGVFAKAGFLAWDGDFTVNNIGASDDSTDPAYGIGAKFQLGSLAIRAEYEVFETDNFDLDFTSVGVAYTF